MKKNLTFFMLFLPCLLTAQIPPGTYLLGVSTGMSTYSQLKGNSAGSSTTNLFRLNSTKLSFGKFVNDKNAFSVFLLGSINTANISNLDKNFTIGLGLGHSYLLPMNKKWGLMLLNEISGTLGRAKLEKQTNYTVGSYQLNASVSPGLYVLLFDNFMLHANFLVFDLELNGVKSDDTVPNNMKVQEKHSVKVNSVLPRALGLLSFNFGLNYLLFKK